MTEAFTSVRDLHTMYVLPKPFDTAVAFVPFQIEGYFVGRDRKYLVSNVIDGLSWFAAPRNFTRGVEVTHWNDIPMPRAVELAGARNAGSNADARLARGLARLTIRPLAKALPPDEEWVTIHYEAERDKTRYCLRVPWRVAVLKAAEALPLDGDEILNRPEGLDYELDVIRTLNKTFYSPALSKAQGQMVFASYQAGSQGPRSRESTTFRSSPWTRRCATSSKQRHSFSPTSATATFAYVLSKSTTRSFSWRCSPTL